MPIVTTELAIAYLRSGVRSTATLAATSHEPCLPSYHLGGERQNLIR
jgi:hypothetical protein